MNTRPLATLTAGVLVAGGAVALYVMPTGGASGSRPDKELICHVAGRADNPANYRTLDLPPSAIYGPGGHFNENGTTQAGHEQDTFGACPTPNTTQETTPETSVTAPETTQTPTTVTETTLPGIVTTAPTAAPRVSEDPPQAPANLIPQVQSPALPASR
jgi:hypothetical protein